MEPQASVEGPTAERTSASDDSSQSCQSDSDVEELDDPKLLRAVAIKYGIESTKSLVAAYNATTNRTERGVLLHWLRRYDERGDDRFKPKHVLEYAELAKIAPRSTQDKEVLKNLVCALGSCLHQRKLPAKNLAMALCRALIHVDASAYGGVADLMVIARKLLASLSPEPKISRENFAEHEATFHALQQTLFLLIKTNNNNIEDKEKQKLRRVIAEKENEMELSCKYYPVSFHFKALRQAVERLDPKDTSLPLSQAMRRAALGMCVILHVLHCVRNLASFDIDPEEIEDSNRRLREMTANVGVSKRPWFDLFRNLMAARLDASKDDTHLAFFEFEYIAAMEYQRTMRKGEDLKALRFGIIQELGTLAAEGSIASAREEATKKLLNLATQEAVNEGWIGDPDVLVALLDVIYTIHKTDQGAEKLQEAFQLLQQSCESFASEALTQWLGGRSLKNKLRARSPRRPVAKRNELFVGVGRDVGYIPLGMVDTKKEQLRKRYLHGDFATVASLFGEGLRSHVKGMKHHVVISEEVVGEQELTSEDETETDIRKAEEREEGSLDRRRDQAEEYYEQKRRVTKPIALEDLFKRRCLKPRVPESEIRRVLLYGNPGSGKTCITKVIAHRWALGEMAQEFDAVYVVPVRVLNSIEHKGQQPMGLEEAISQICFSKGKRNCDCEDLVAQIDDDLDSPSTLLAVDGLDEANDHSTDLISNIWSRSCKVLLLSRPYNMRNVETRVDIQVECLGFNDQQLRDYIRSELAADEAPRLIRSLESSAAMWEMAHIPVTAHILCSLSKEHGTVIQEGRRASAFQIYNDMANYVWKRFEQKPSAGNVNKSEVFGDLERLAFEGLRKGVILIHERFVMENATSKDAAWTFKESGLLLLVLEGQEYQFPHLTFQEYFAGRYIARSLKQKGSDEETRVHDFIEEGKYNKKHALTLSFAMHAFAKGRSKKALKEMLSIVDRQPVELLGVHHFFLRMRTLEATIEEADEAGLESLVKDGQAIKVAEGARLLLEKTIDNVLIREIVVEHFEQCSCVLEKFPKILNDTFDKTKTLLEISRNLTWKEKDKIKDVLKLAKHSSKHVGDIRSFLQLNTKAAYWRRLRDGTARLQTIAKEIPQLAGDLLPVFQEKCGDEDSHVRWSALEAIRDITQAAPHLVGDLIPVLQQRCVDERFSVRSNSMLVISHIARAAPHLAGDLMSVIQQGCVDKAFNVRRSAMEAVRDIVQAAPYLVGDLLPVLQQGCVDKAFSVRASAISVMGDIAKVVPDLAGDLLPVVTQGCVDKDSVVRKSAILEIGSLAKAVPHLAGDLWPVLQKGCMDEDSHVRCCAIRAIGDIFQAVPRLAGDLWPVLQKGCGDKYSVVRGSAMLAIRDIAQAVPHFAGVLLPVVQQGCADKASSMRSSAISALGDIAKATPHLAGDLLPVLQKRYIDKDSVARRSAISAIGSLAKAVPHFAGDSLPVLQKGCIDEDSHVRCCAIRAIGDIVQALPHLARVLLPVLQKACGENSDVRGEATQAIGDIAQAVPHLANDLLPLLQKRYNDEEFYVHEVAKKTLFNLNVQKITLLAIFSPHTYTGAFLLLVLKNAFTLDFPSDSERGSLVSHTTSSEKIGEWDKKDLDKFVVYLRQEFDESFPGLSGYLKTKD